MTTGDQYRSAERRALELLPWYVNGTLVDGERELVRRELLSSLTCRKEFGRLRSLHQTMQRDDGETVATERAFERLMARIEDCAIERPERRQNLRRPVAWPYFAQAALLLGLVSGIVWWQFPAPPAETPTYGTLSEPEPVGAGVTRLRVVFAPGMSDAALREMLVEYRLTIIDGPTRDGLYTLMPVESADTRKIVEALKADPRVVFTSTPAAAEIR